VGLCFIAEPFLWPAKTTDWGAVAMGVAFLAYGLGGHRLLAKVAPSWSAEVKLRRSAKDSSESSKPPAA